MAVQRRPRGWMRRLVQLALTVLVTWFVVSRVEVSLQDALAVPAALSDLSAGMLTASVLVLLGGLVFSAWLWGRMASEIGGGRPSLIAAVRIVFSANLGRYLPGRLWPIAGLAFLSGRAGITVAAAGVAGALGQLFALAAVGVLASPVLVSANGSLGRAFIVTLVVLAAFVVLASIRRVQDGVLGAAFRLARASSDVPSLDRLFGVRWLALYLFNWVVYAGAFVLFVRSLGFTAPWLGLVSGFTAAYLLGYVAFFAPAGLGVREGFLIVFLQAELGAAATAVAILTRVWMTVVELVPAGGFAVWEAARSKGEASRSP